MSDRFRLKHAEQSRNFRHIAMSTDRKNPLVSFPCPPILKAQMTQLATADHRTLAAWIRLKLTAAVARSMRKAA